MQIVSNSICVLRLLLNGSEFVELFAYWEWPSEEYMEHMIKYIECYT
jgi:hypothetical protein